MLQLKNVREVVREGTEEPTGVVLTQVIVVYGVVLNHVHFNNLNGRWLCLRAIGIQELAKQFRFLFLKHNICYEIFCFRSGQEVWLN